ncbi:HAD family phosphatase [Solihabitans fulvus]|uniref:HAD family phosphatase n=1 Tax=Solihabitans fulvus TaxID=1892852 RepID=A0A5B2XVY9_9PSEU|nr:HAD family phosphatase [Solihabitans fulvus]KAA2267052.1 HAD family phosphatase [Solihabitans fulvus]
MHEAALFDLDGTLVDTEPRSQAAWGRLFRTHGVPHDERLLASFAGRPGREVLAAHHDQFGDEHSVDDLLTEAMSYATLPAAPVAGAVELVRRLHEQRVPVGVVTSGTRDYAHGELAVIGLLPLFAVVVTAEDVVRGKPDPEGYLAGCRALGVPPGRVVAFEDAPAGVAAAKSAGLHCVALTTTQPADALSSADRVVADLTAVRWPLGSA